MHRPPFFFHEMNHLLRNPALSVHLWHERAYSWWKSRETGVQLRAPLSVDERRFYLQLRWALMGSDLVVYDIGAASGVLSGCLAKLANVRAVHAFEPIPSAFAQLSARMRPYPHVTCHNVAVGESNGPMDTR